MDFGTVGDPGEGYAAGGCRLEPGPPDYDPRDWDWLPALDEVSATNQPPPDADPVAADFLDLAELSRAGFEQLDRSGQLDALVMIDAQLGWLSAQQHQLLALIAAGDSSAERWCVEEVGAALRLSGGAARSRLKNAQQLVERLSGTFQALADGTISTDQARVITEASYELPDDRLAGYEQRVLARAPEQSVGQTRQSARRAALAADPATAEVRHQRAMADRHVRIAPADAGMAWLLALLPAAEAQAIHARLDSAARTAPSWDDRTTDQLRADALVEAFLDTDRGVRAMAGDDQAENRSQRRLRPTISVTVALSTLLAADDEPGWLDGYGPIPASYARELAHDPTGTWRRLITDPVSGQLLDYGVTSYRPPKHLAEHVIARDGSCTFPFCNHLARQSDLDHITPYGDGPTSPQNLQPLHRRHHNAKTHGGWRAERDETTGVTSWTSPLGRTYRSQPEQRWPLPDDPPF